MSNSIVCLALYKGKRTKKYLRFFDFLVRKITKGQYSHCEIVVEKIHENKKIYNAYSSSVGIGVRKKQININNDKWDLIQLENLTENKVSWYFKLTKGKPYDYFGVFGLVFGLKQSKNRYFCSEWCFNLIFNSNEGWRFSPNDLAAIFKK